MKEELKIIFKIWELDEEWNRINDPQLNWYGNMTFRRLNDSELFRSVAISEEQKALKKELRKKIGLWNYLKFTFWPLRYAKSLSDHPTS